MGKKVSISKEMADLCREILTRYEKAEQEDFDKIKKLRTLMDMASGEMHVRTMTIKELTDRLRSVGFKTSTKTVTGLITHGLYPFAVGYIDGQANCEIYTKKIEKWLDEVADRSEK